MRIAIIGSRGYKHLGRVSLKVMDIALADPNAVIISGGAAGVDDWAKSAADTWGLTYKEFKPDFSKGYDVRQYHLRNDQIIQDADKVIAFWDGSSRGTMSVIEKCRKLGKPIEIVDDTKHQLKL